MIKKLMILTPLAAMLLLTAAAPAQADALAKACWSKPSALPKQKCICYENELRKVLSPDEMRIQILDFRGKYAQYRKKIKAMNASNAKSFMNRVNSVVHGSVCNR